jgi:hypothetical protein
MSATKFSAMNKSILIKFSGIITAIICCYSLWSSKNQRPSSTGIRETISSPISGLAKSDVQQSIAFILGKDKDDNNKYYEEALHYYTTNSKGKTDYLITNCRSLSDVKNYLKTNRPSNGLPWGRVHLISHGNQWTGLSVKVYPGSKRATPERITDLIQSDTFECLPSTIIDSRTKIFVHGCGVGNDSALIEAIGDFMSSKTNRPVIHAPKLFEYFASVRNENEIVSERYLSECWFVSYPMENRPSNLTVIKKLREKYSDAPVDWRSSLQRKKPRWIGDAYHYTFEVPVKWITPATDSLSDLSTNESQIVWLKKQHQIVEALDKLQIPIENFKWTFSVVYKESNDGGNKVPLFLVKGYCTILCVLSVLTDGHSETLTLQKPFVPDVNDNRFYYTSGGIASQRLNFRNESSKESVLELATCSTTAKFTTAPFEGFVNNNLVPTECLRYHEGFRICIRPFFF